MIAFRDIRLSLGGSPILQGFDWEPAAGRLSLLAGSNGAGKSSALKVAAGLWRPDAGGVLFGGERLPSGSPRPQLIAYLPQAPGFHPGLRTLALLRFYARAEGRSREAAERALDSFGLGDHRNHRGGELSGGLRQRLGLAVLSLSEAPVWLLDEPGLSLDPPWRQRLQSWLRDETRAGRTILVATHLLAEWEGKADDCAVCEKGRVEGRLDPDALREPSLRINNGGRDSQIDRLLRSKGAGA